MMSIGREFVFSYMNTKNSVTFDGVNLVCKMGPFRKKIFPVNNVVHYYIFENNNYRSLYFAYMDESGKMKRVQLMSQLGEIGFRDLVEELHNSIGAKGLNHLPEKEAFKAMQASNPKKMAPIVGMIVILVLTTSIFYPGLRHYFDFGFENAEVQQLIAGEDIGTRNLNLLGIPLNESLEETTTTTKNGSTSKNTKVYIPIVPPDWDYDKPVDVIMEFDALSDSEYDAILESSEFVGVVRNIWYEGLEQDQKDFFKDEYDIAVNDDAILFEVTGNEHNDSMIFWIWLGLNGIFVIIFTVAALKQK